MKDKFTELVKNNKSIIAGKKSAIKLTDSFYTSKLYGKKITADKSFNLEKEAGENEVKVKVIINTTNLLDSHDDVHIKGIWDDSIKNTKNIIHLQEHNYQLDKVISDGENLAVYTEEFSFSELGFGEYDGNTQALVFDSIVSEKRNSFMYGQYKSGYVKEHSVGMRYEDLVLCVNDEDYKDEFANWNKYFDFIANKEDAEAQGYFYAILEASIVEGSAVIKGSNFVTPTLITEESKGISKELEEVDLTDEEALEIIKELLEEN